MSNAAVIYPKAYKSNASPSTPCGLNLTGLENGQIADFRVSVL